ncbi:MAG: hypothetical protein J7M38_15360, partial [Armatimonadetes bacterium]|nr:hypothetical protein [Armatimonadota bacterium]
MNSTLRRIALVILLLSLLASIAVAEAVRACTIEFADQDALVFAGAYRDLAGEPTNQPLEIANVR